MEEANADGRQGVCVFTPAPLFTITIEQPEELPAEVHFHAGGQGIWVARMAASLGAQTTLCGPFGGEAGLVARMLIEAEGVTVLGVDAPEANGGYVHDRRSGKREPIVEVKSPRISRHELDDLYNTTLTASLDAGVLVLTGSPDEVIPSSMFGRLAADRGANGVAVVADLSRDDLASLDGGVTFLKVSDEDLKRDGFLQDDAPATVVRAIRALNEKGSKNVIVSRGGEPAIALVDGQLVEVVPPQFEPLEHRGAGDSMCAAIAAGLAFGMSGGECLRLGAAAGALNVTRHGLGTGRREHVERVAEEVQLRPLAL